ncbi:hypothetical protein ACROYT_G043091 [Oculina patagonica]
MEYYKVVEPVDDRPDNVSDVREYQGRFKRAVALHMAKKRERRQKRAAMKAKMIDQLKKKAEECGIKLETRPAGYVYQVGADLTSPEVRYTVMPPPPYEEHEKPYHREGLAELEAARKA